MEAKPQILFVCVHNAGRSQMAAALTEMHGMGLIEVLSAGSEPADEINPVVAEAMAELRIDITARRPHPLSTEAVRESDVVVTMGCGDACPVFPGKQYIDWELDDPAGKDLDAVREIRNEINLRVMGLVQTLLDDGEPRPRHASRQPD
ncbi:MAG: arsenate reductase ArsC [Acidimicrobiia bacterium]|nr:arsenate reductase ArsC [Acidimicrobiia bacterium]